MCTPPPLRDDLRFSNTTGICQKKTMWFIGVDVEQETSAPPPKKKILDPPLIGYRKATQIGLGTDLRRLQTSPKLLTRL